MINLFTFLVCFTASVIGGLCGVGGGVLAKPLLDAAGVMPIATVSFLSGLTVLSMAAISVYKNRKTDSLQWKRSLPLGIGAALGGVLGKWLFGVLRGLAGADHLVGCVQSAALGIFTLGILFYVRFRGRPPCSEQDCLRADRDFSGIDLRISGNRRRPHEHRRIPLLFFHGHKNVGC